MPPTQHPPHLPPRAGALPPGTVVGHWRVVESAGRGAHGAVYRAVPVEEDAQACPVALKVALVPWDERFEREAELLSRVRHPSIPRLWAQGQWQPVNGPPHPFLVMDWVEGAPLYEWAQEQGATSQQVLGVLAQVAEALAAVHALKGVHRDVKGCNVRVRRSDGRAMLLDWGTGVYEGAAPLTPPGTFPGTPAYQSPEATLASLRAGRDGAVRYSAGPLEDVYALGVMAHRLVTGQYPEVGEPTQDEAGTWRIEGRREGAVRVLNPRVDVRLSQCIDGMLTVAPEQRGSAAHWAQEMEQASRSAGMESLLPRVPRPVAEPKRRRGKPGWTVAAAAGLALAVGALFSIGLQSPWAARRHTRQEADTAGLAEKVSAASVPQAPEAVDSKGMAEEPLPEPVPGQTRPNAKGQCPFSGQVVLNGVCWGKFEMEQARCEGFGGVFFKKVCYLPFASRQRPPTSSPPHEP